jgi:hypothetical protein
VARSSDATARSDERPVPAGGSAAGDDASRSLDALHSPEPGDLAALYRLVPPQSGRTFRFGRWSLRFDGDAERDAREDGESLALLRAELVLLRTENARLKLALQQDPGSASLSGAIRRPAPSGLDAGDEAMEWMADALVVRQALLEICREIEWSVAGFRERLNRPAPATGRPARMRRGGAGVADDE